MATKNETRDAMIMWLYSEQVSALSFFLLIAILIFFISDDK